MKDLLKQTLLYDFYGELLTSHQKQIYEDYIFNDLSLSEIAEQNNISRQGVYDLVKRCGNILNEYESKLNLIEKFEMKKSSLKKINDLVKQYRTTGDDSLLQKIEQISGEIPDDL